MQTASAQDGLNRLDTPRSRAAMARATRIIAPAIAGIAPMQQLLQAPARWTIRHVGTLSEVSGTPRLHSPRRRGKAPAHPQHASLRRMTDGAFVIFPTGFVLEPCKRCQPCVNVSKASIVMALFYRDAVDVTLSSGERVTICIDPVEHVDSIFRAYFWNPVTQ